MDRKKVLKITLENSLILCGFRNIYSGSLVICLLRFLRLVSYQIADGSKTLSIFKVNDYLKSDSDKILSTKKLSRTYRLWHKHGSPLMYRLKKLLNKLSLSKCSLWVILSELRGRCEVELTRRNILFFCFAFLGAFYAARSALLIIFPRVDMLVPWSSGLVLFVIMSILLQLFKSAGKESGEAAGGVLQNSARTIAWIFKNFGLLIVWLVKSAFKQLR